MATFGLIRRVYKSGSSAAKHSISYITRTPEYERHHAQRYITHMREESRGDLVETGVRNLPKWAHGDSLRYFKAAQQYERVNGKAYETWIVTLPRELSTLQNRELVRDIIEAVAEDKFPLVYAFHNPPTLNKENSQPHMHLVISARCTDGIERGEQGHFRRWNAAEPWKGGAQKGRQFLHLGSVEANRALVSDVINLHLEAHGVTERVYPGSLKSLGIDRKPEQKMYPSETDAYKKDQTRSDKFISIMEARGKRDRQAEAERIRIAWEHRKRYLGIVEGTSWEDALRCVVSARDDRIAMPPQVESTAKLRVVERAAQREVMRVGRGVKRDRHEVRGGLHLHVFERGLHEN